MSDSPFDFSLTVDQVLGAGGLVASALSGYEERPVQLEMARAVSRALARDDCLLVEAGTGTGKTLAYLVPALLSGKKVVISTGTKTLQDQIMRSDLPLLERAFGQSLPIACMKGLANYVCLRRYDEFRHSARAASSRAGRDLTLLQRFVETSDSGDRAELGLDNDAAIWSEVHSGSDTRIGAKCRFYDECFITRMRRTAEQAQVVVVNHHLFFADLALRGPRGAGAIPSYDAVVFDEAHLIEDIATDFFGVSVSSARVERLLHDATRSLAAASLLKRAEPLLSQVAVATSAFFSALPRPAGEGGRVPLPPEVFEGRVREPMFALDTALEGLSALCKQNVSESEAIAQLARRASALRDDIATIAGGGSAAQVTWTLARGRSSRIGASPVELGAILQERLFYTGVGTVLTSATLATDHSFEFVRSRLGLDDGAEELQLASPFDYAAQACLYLPQGLGDPRDDAFLPRASEEILSLVELTGGGAFVLCTSLRAMRAFCSALRPRLSRPVLMQGEAPNAALIERFRAAGDAVLFATASFWQGVDVAGDALRLVVIDKLPFDVPTDPLVRARCDRLEQAGVAPFMKYLVPAAALTLKQGFGRLIRGSSERGIVAVLDERLTRKGYGKVFLRSLPPATRCRTMQEVARFWAGTR